MRQYSIVHFMVLLFLPSSIINSKDVLLTNNSFTFPVSTLPTTINLNDNNDLDIREYYSSLNELSYEERQGTNLLKNLKTIISKDQKYYSFDSDNKIWQMYEITDRDWIKSPASETTYGTYDSKTNTINNYQYGKTSDIKNNPYIHALYNNRDLDNEAKAWGDHNQNAWGINREHIWAKSHGFDEKESDSTGGARGDPMHLWAGNGWANHEHSNYFFAFVDKNREYSDAGTKYQTSYNNLTGYSINAGGNEKVFEPQDSDKGDIARAIFYMAARYNYYSGSDVNPINANNPNLVILNDLSENSRTGTSSETSSYGMGLLSDLLAWNKLDPVDEYEIHRNNLLYNNYTNNRNPFIDFPEWANYIWGTADIDGTHYNPTLAGAADPINDPINDKETSFIISVKNIILKEDENIKIYGSNTKNSINWSIDDNSIASLNKTSSISNEEIIVTALKKGTTIIHASTSIENEVVTKDIPVLINGLVISSLTLSGYKKDFKVNDKFTTGDLSIVANFKDSSKTKVITSGYTITNPDMSKAGKQTVTITYEGVSSSYEINIEDSKSSLLIIIVVGSLSLITIIIFTSLFTKKKRKRR